MMRLTTILTAMIVVSSPVGAATLSVADGDILVSSGNGFVRAKAGQDLRAGDRVMVGSRGGKAEISYDQACVEQIHKGLVVTVKPAAPCAAESGDGRDSLKDGRAAGGAGTGGTGGAPGVGAAGLPNSALVAGGIAIAVGVGVGIHHLNKPSSP